MFANIGIAKQKDKKGYIPTSHMFIMISLSNRKKKKKTIEMQACIFQMMLCSEGRKEGISLLKSISLIMCAVLTLEQNFRTCLQEEIKRGIGIGI